jgi:formylglycine-generating enzyme required for sulfatase activity
MARHSRVVDHRQNFQPPTVLGGVKDEIVRPDVVGPERTIPDSGISRPAVLPDTRPASVPVRVTEIVNEMERGRVRRRGGGRGFIVAAVVALGLLVVAVLLVGGGYYAYTQFGQPVVSSGPVNPEAVRGVAARMEFVPIPAGTFLMGVPENEPGGTDPETPHRVTLTKPFEMGKFEVTQEEWQSVMGGNPSKFSGCAACPVDQVNWNDCQDFLKRMNDYSDLYVYRLPTEAEWEFACRGGTTESAPSPLGDFAWIRDNSGQMTHPVGKKRPNGYGLYDMYGNVWEWCQDYFGEYPKEAVKDPKGPMEGKYRVFRGGGWSSESVDCPAWKRLISEPEDRKLILGFRVVRERR